MELTFEQQSLAFLLSILLGVVFGIVYGVFAIFRIAFCSGKLSIIIADVVYMLLVSLSIFIFSLAYLLGYVRVYVYFGCLLGFCAYRFSIGRFTRKIYEPIIRLVKSISHKIQLIFKKIAKKLLKSANKILYNVSNKISSYRKRHLAEKNKRVIAKNEKRKRKKISKNG